MSMRVLVVDDSALARRTLRQHLEELGHTVDEATNGEQALERFALNPPDLMILDMVMSGMYGLDVLTHVRELNPTARVLVVTADIQNSTAEQARNAGASGLLNKPVSRERLARAVDEVARGGQTWN